jgi:DNA polymerase-3 subunit epsilon
MREKHGALLDSEILAEVYLELIGGRQPDLVLGGGSTLSGQVSTDEAWRPKPRPAALPPRFTLDEAEAHARFVAALGEAAVWNRTS